MCFNMYSTTTTTTNLRSSFPVLLDNPEPRPCLGVVRISSAPVRMSQFCSSQHLQEFCTKSLKQYLRETLELQSAKESEKKINIRVNNVCQDNQHCQDTSSFSSSSNSSCNSSYSDKPTESKQRTIPHFIQWQAPIVEWLNPLREWQVVVES